eukprot:6197015-Pleurochrysis_carterae.AAC.2
MWSLQGGQHAMRDGVAATRRKVKGVRTPLRMQPASVVMVHQEGRLEVQVSSHVGIHRSILHGARLRAHVIVHLKHRLGQILRAPRMNQWAVASNALTGFVADAA